MKLFSLLPVLLLCATAFAEPERSLYLVGEGRTTSPSGEWRSSAVYLIRRRVIPDENRIEIRSTLVEADGTVRRHTAIMQVSGNTYTVSDPGGTYAGTGRWTGPAPWQWTNWSYQATFTNGSGRLEGEDKLTDSRLEMRKRYFDRAGNHVQTISADFSFISERAYEILLSKL